MMELGPLQKEWIARLRSGKYKQCAGKLHDSKDDSYCCLGLACEMLRIPRAVGSKRTIYFDGEIESEGTMPGISWHGLGLYHSDGRHKDFNSMMVRQVVPETITLASLNDKGFTFEEIADVIEANPDHYFKESK